MSKPELLAPAGDYNSAVAAVEAGADAIYFGGKEFSARNFAVNFSRKEIVRAISYAHLRGVKCYAAVNTLIKDAEFAKFFDYIKFLYAEGIDALIIQDLGVLALCKKYWLDLPLHASTQMTAHNLNDVLELEKLGFKRVVLARELTLEEIQEIKNKVKIELECFVHGALCFSYSGQCYMSSMIGGRSGNRGRCAQPCRKKYNLAELRTGKILDRNGYLMSTRDLCTLDILESLNSIDSLKIEGRMKGAAYVAGVVEKYRKYIDSLARNEKISGSEIEEDKKELAEIFNRGGFSHGYLLEKKPKDLVATNRSKNFGVKAGEVVEARSGWAKIKIYSCSNCFDLGQSEPARFCLQDKTSFFAKATAGQCLASPVAIKNKSARFKENDGKNDLNKNIVNKLAVGVNDGLEIWGRGGQEVNFGFRVEKISGGFIEIWPEENADIKVGDAVYKNFDYELNKKLNLLSQENYQWRISVEMEFIAEEGKNIVLKMNGVEVFGEKAEKARQRATEPEAIKTQLAKLGGTVFVASEVKVNIKDGLNISAKDLNAVRREAAAKLEKNIIDSFKREKKLGKPNALIIQRIKVNEKTEKKNRICVQSNDLNVLNELADKKISRIYTALRINIEKFYKNNIEVFQALPRIFRSGEKLEIFSGYDGFLVPALGCLRILPLKAKKIGDFSLNIFNSLSAQQLEKMGFSGFTASIESTLSEINGIEAGEMKKEAIVYGYLPLMIAEHCVLYGTPNCKKIKLGITDEKRINFPIYTDCVNCRMQILNSVPLYFTDIDGLEADSIRLIHTIETPEEFLKKIDNYLSEEFGLVENTTAGHFYRGVE